MDSRTQHSPQRTLQRLGACVFTVVILALVVFRPTTCSLASTLEGQDEDYPEVFDDLAPHLEETYWDLRRFQPLPQLRRSLAQLENSADEVYIEYADPLEERVRVHVGDSSKFFSLKGVATLRQAFKLLKEVFAFVQETYKGKSALNDIRIATLNGFLSGLDPHTLVFSKKAFEDFYVHIEGEIFGVGMLVGTRGDGRLTVIEVLKNTPALKAGFRKGDLITRIDDESTVNMSVNEAVQKIRGKRGTDVVLSIKRKEAGDDKLTTKKIAVTRDRVIIKSVESKLLLDGIGYALVTNFDKNTVDLLRQNLEKLAQEYADQGGKGGLAGLILDLRNNSGGLLNQASAMADLFLESGEIYSIAERDSVETHSAKDDGNEPSYPIVVLCNDASASGAEIVIGALQRNRRALVLGTATFGKGSVQQLHPLPPSPAFFGSRNFKAQLKITVSEYLIPGKISIQENGVVPDIEAQVAAFADKEIDLFANARRNTEKDYEFHIVSKFAKDLTPLSGIQYPFVVDAKKERSSDRLGDKFMSGEIEPLEDKLVQVALQIQRLWKERPESLREATFDGPTVVESLRDGIDAVRKDLENDIRKLLLERGIDWSDGPAPAAKPDVALELGHEFSTRPSEDEEKPYPEPILVLKAKATNRSSAAVHRLAGLTDSDNLAYGEREFLFGKIEPGASVERRIEIPIRPSSASRSDVLAVRLVSPSFQEPLVAANHEVVIAAEKFPEFRYSLTLYENGKDAPIEALEPGMDLRLVASIENIGDAPVRKGEGVAILRNQNGKDVFLDVGRIETDDLAPGQKQDVEFKFQVHAGAQREAYKFEFGVFGSFYPIGLSREFEIPGGKANPAQFKNGERFQASNIRLRVAESDPKAAAPASPLVTPKERIRLSAVIEDTHAPFQAWVSVSQLSADERHLPDKVAFAESEPTTPSQLELTAELPLKVGQNVIAVNSTNERGLNQRRILFVRRTAN
jgi:carboxyl-terminal processing protease